MNSNNPYAATKAPLRDEPLEAVRRPVTVWVALVILWIMFVLLAFATFVAGWTIIKSAQGSGIMLIAILSFASICIATLLVKTGSGRNWARILTTLWALAMLIIGFATQNYSRFPPAMLVGALLPPTLIVVGLVLLYVPSSNAWFRSRKE